MPKFFPHRGRGNCGVKMQSRIFTEWGLHKGMESSWSRVFIFHAPVCESMRARRTHTHTHTLSLSLSLSQMHTHTQYTYRQTHTVTHMRTHAFSLTHTCTCTHSHVHIQQNCMEVMCCSYVRLVLQNLCMFVILNFMSPLAWDLSCPDIGYKDIFG